MAKKHTYARRFLRRMTDLPFDTLKGEGAQGNKSCIACSKCTQIMRDHGRTGCVIRDANVYAPLFQQYRKEADERAAQAK